MAYQETTREIKYLSDGTQIEVFGWREDTNDPYTPEAQYIEPVSVSEEYPSGIKVWWRTFENLQTVLEMDLTEFQTNVLPKPTKRGGSPNPA